MSLRRWGILTLFCALSYAPSLGQTSQPAAATTWQETVANLSKTLTEGSDETAAVNALNELIPNDATILKFTGSEPESRYSLRQLCGGLGVVSSRTYGWPMETFVSDLTADLRNCDAMPETLRRSLTPRDEAETKRANATAQQWASALLHPAPGELVAVIVLWQVPPPLENRLILNAAPVGEDRPPIFVLVKGKKTGDDQIRILQVVFGDAKQALD